MRWDHAVQREVARVMSPVWVPATALVLRFVFGLRVENLAEIRARYRALRAQTNGPLLICANHLTMIDSFIIAWALANPWRYVFRFSELAWNTPERNNFGKTPIARTLIYLAKCIAITRGGARDEVAAVLARVIHLTQRGETAMIFPEGGRSRSGRVEVERAAWGVGRIVGAVDGCRVLCVYMRGEKQDTWSDFPAHGDRIHVDFVCIEPKSDARGVRRSRELSMQIVSQLRNLEQEFFDGRE